MTDKTRAKNLTFYERRDQVETGLRCYAGAAARADAAARRDARRGAGGRIRLRIVLVSSSPELRDELAQQIIADADDGSRLEVTSTGASTRGGAGGGRRAAALVGGGGRRTAAK